MKKPREIASHPRTFRIESAIHLILICLKTHADLRVHLLRHRLSHFLLVRSTDVSSVYVLKSARSLSLLTPGRFALHINVHFLFPALHARILSFYWLLLLLVSRHFFCPCQSFHERAHLNPNRSEGCSLMFECFCEMHEHRTGCTFSIAQHYIRICVNNVIVLLSSQPAMWSAFHISHPACRNYPVVKKILNCSIGK